MTRKKSQKKVPISKENPFNIKVNRSKHSVLGQKLKGTRGLPGVSHSVGNAKRREEFHKKRINSQKANKFLDKRLMDNSLSLEEQATLRFVEERRKKLKKNIFNLNEEESLTHQGVPLEYQNSFSDALNNSDDEEQLDPQFVKHAHFGGFTEDSSSTAKSRKEIIDELIAESKKRKMERKMIRERNRDLINEVDQEWKELHKILPMKGKKENSRLDKSDPPKQNLVSNKSDSFDVVLKELKFESKATPCGRTKTPEEIAKEEKEKEKKLIEEQYKRMKNPMDDQESQNDLLSADSIYDGLDIQFEPIEDDENYDAVNNFANREGQESEDENESDSDSEFENEMNNLGEDGDFHSVNAVDDISDVPDSLEKLQNIISKSSEEFHVVVGNILKDKIKSRSKQNLEKLENFFVILLEYIMNFNNVTKMFETLDDILPYLYALIEYSPVNTSEKLLAFLDKEHEIFQQSKGKKLKKDFPKFQSLVLFKVISITYSVSDFKHPVVTPAIVFMCDILSNGYVVTYQNTVVRLLISHIIFDCVSFSKRYVPEIFWFLNKVLELALVNNKRFNLFIGEAVVNEHKADINFEITDKLCNSAAKVSIISETVELLHKFSESYKQLECYKEIFSSSLNILKSLPIENYPNFLKESITAFIANVEKVESVYKPLTLDKRKPVPLKLFEPAFDSKFTRKKDDIQKKRNLVKNVSQKIRKEEKGILREMRRDNQVIASEKLKETLEADEERKRKVKQLYQELAMQEGEFKKYVKKK